MTVEPNTAGPESSSEVVEGPAYTQPFKVLTVIITALLGVFFLQTYLSGGMGKGVSAGIGWFIAGYAMILLFTGFILTSRTRIAEQEITQSWVWQKRVTPHEIGFARFIYYPSASWLVAPRLYMMLSGGRITTIYVASPELYRKAAEVALKYQRNR